VQPAAQPPGPPTSADLYRQAEAALARRDPAAADRALAKLLADDPHSPLADQALYERARIAYQRHAWSEARRHLDALATIPTTPLTEPGRYLACRIAVEAHDADAAHCLADYRAVYPRSAHDPDVLAMLVQLVHADTGCAGARKLVDELVRLYPASRVAHGWRERCPEAK
jgi:outer membrane protein assembly factor BamD (BamD/ComL family)